MTGFGRDHRIDNAQRAYEQIKSQRKRAIRELTNVYTKMQNLRFGLERHGGQNGPFTPEHLSQLEAEYDSFKQELQNVLDSAPADLPKGGNDIVGVNKQP